MSIAACDSVVMPARPIHCSAGLRASLSHSRCTSPASSPMSSGAWQVAMQRVMSWSPGS